MAIRAEGHRHSHWDGWRKRRRRKRRRGGGDEEDVALCATKDAGGFASFASIGTSSSNSASGSDDSRRGGCGWESEWGLDWGREEDREDEATATAVAHFARSRFPFFSRDADAYGGAGGAETEAQGWVFLENAGGSQVPQCVLDGASEALAARWRSELGPQHVGAARHVAACMLNAQPDPPSVSPSLPSSTLSTKSALDRKPEWRMRPTTSSATWRIRF